jgi:hypothetical protein
MIENSLEATGFRSGALAGPAQSLTAPIWNGYRNYYAVSTVCRKAKISDDQARYLRLQRCTMVIGFCNNVLIGYDTIKLGGES